MNNETLEWRHAKDWKGFITIDEIDVSRDCKAVGFRDDIPVAVELLKRGPHGNAIYDHVKDELITEVVYSETIVAELSVRGVHL